MELKLSLTEHDQGICPITQLSDLSDCSVAISCTPTYLTDFLLAMHHVKVLLMVTFRGVLLEKIVREGEIVDVDQMEQTVVLKT